VNVGGWLGWSLLATVLLTLIVAGAQGLGWTRVSMPFLLGTMFTADRDRARVIGIGVHLVNGWIFGLVYEAIFWTVRVRSVSFGAALGLLHGLFVAAVLLPALPGIHPRMAGTRSGPTAARVLEPPGFLGLHYGYQTPLVIVLSHVAFGALLGLGAAAR